MSPCVRKGAACEVEGEIEIRPERVDNHVLHHQLRTVVRTGFRDFTSAAKVFIEDEVRFGGARIVTLPETFLNGGPASEIIQHVWTFAIRPRLGRGEVRRLGLARREVQDSCRSDGVQCLAISDRDWDCHSKLSRVSAGT